MVKRVSIKGKGADIFFGDYTPAQPQATPTNTEIPSSLSIPKDDTDGSSTPDTPAMPPLPERVDTQEIVQEETDEIPSGMEQTQASKPELVQVLPAKKAGPKRANDSMKATQHVRQPESPNASYHASMLAGASSEIIETIRKTVKLAGKEVSFVRLTPAEKGQLIDIVYSFKRQGQRTSETEINRIAVNFMLLDYRANGANSIIAKVIAALLA